MILWRLSCESFMSEGVPVYHHGASPIDHVLEQGFRPVSFTSVVDPNEQLARRDAVDIDSPRDPNTHVDTQFPRASHREPSTLRRRCRTCLDGSRGPPDVVLARRTRTNPQQQA